MCAYELAVNHMILSMAREQHLMKVAGQGAVEKSLSAVLCSLFIEKMLPIFDTAEKT